MTEHDIKLDVLWGGIIHSTLMNFNTASLELHVEVIDSGIVSTYSLLLAGIKELHHVRSSNNWDYTELTSITVEPGQKNRMPIWRVLIELWDSDNTIEIECSDISLNGKLLRQ